MQKAQSCVESSDPSSLIAPLVAAVNGRGAHVSSVDDHIEIRFLEAKCRDSRRAGVDPGERWYKDY